MPSVDEVERAAQRGEHAQSEHVDLQQAERFEIVLVPLDHAAILHCRGLDRHHAREFVARDDEAADVLRQVARKAVQRVRELHPVARDRRRQIDADLGEALRHLGPVVEPLAGLGHRVDQRRVQPQRLADVAHRAARAVAGQRGGERGAVRAVLAVDVLDDLFAPLVLEVDVDVRRLVALLRDEALEQQRGVHRVHRGDPEAIAHCRVGRRAAALAEDALRARVPHDVVHGEEEGLVALQCDQRQLLLDLLAHLRRNALRVALEQAGFGELAQMAGRRLARRHDLRRVFVAERGE